MPPRYIEYPVLPLLTYLIKNLCYDNEKTKA